MDNNRDQNSQPQQGSHQAGPNETLQQAGTVPDYGRAGESSGQLEQEHSGIQGGRQGNSSIPEDEDEGPDAP
ncbi:MAG TPA: hypothetical protein VHK69_06935 [Chitinophagaceae bacterium]|nr:hypothetical protein [Chitinophagaceae bacterium]